MTARKPLFPGVCAVLLTLPLLLPAEARAHAKGLYKTRAEAEKRARELGCKGTHQNNGLWMPCSGEAMLHKQLREK
ncbi:MAG: DUF3721 domain-containing protein [Cyanobacteriota bacterium]|nr:DUF3721 domain-containing protein [Cyanobacteriota bacterium]